MNRVKYVPASATARALSPSAVLVVKIAQGKIATYRKPLFTNGMEFARQVGALPPQDSGPERAMAAAFNAKTTIEKKIRNR